MSPGSDGVDWLRRKLEVLVRRSFRRSDSSGSLVLALTSATAGAGGGSSFAVLEFADLEGVAI